jgi:cation diffusion facilitator CzcD-associated flavoprotein CzcO
VLGTYEYSDYPLNKETYGVQEGQHLPAEVVHRYLTDYAREFSVYERIRFDSKVESAERKDGGGWLITMSGRPESSTHPLQIFASKLIVATGLTSDPFIPILKGSESFEAPLFHSKGFKDNASTVDSAKNVVVLGGAKSAFDVVYAYASKGVQVDWIIRESGRGPIWMAPPYVTPLKKLLEKLTQTRFLTVNSPSFIIMFVRC